MPAATNVRILVADDNRCGLMTICRMLAAMDCEATGAHDGLEALSRFERGDYDLVLTDIQMPFMDGWELTRRIKSLAPDTPVIAMTGMGREEVGDRLAGSRLDRVLFKPFNLDQLEDAVAVALEARYLNAAPGQA